MGLPRLVDGLEILGGGAWEFAVGGCRILYLV